MQYLVGVKGVVHAHVVGVVELKANVDTRLGHLYAAGTRLLWRGAIFLGDVLAYVLAFGGHAGVELKGVPTNLVGCAHGLQGGRELLVANDAPRTHDVRDDVNL